MARTKSFKITKETQTIAKRSSNRLSQKTPKGQDLDSIEYVDRILKSYLLCDEEYENFLESSSFSSDRESEESDDIKDMDFNGLESSPLPDIFPVDSIISMSESAEGSVAGDFEEFEANFDGKFSDVNGANETNGDTITSMEEYLSFQDSEDDDEPLPEFSNPFSKVPVLNYRCHNEVNLALVNNTIKPEFVVFSESMIPQPNIRKNLPGVILKTMKVSESVDYKTKYQDFIQKKYVKSFFDKV